MLTFRPFNTSRRWELPDPDTGHLHTGRTRSELVANIVNYRSQNRLEPITKMDLVIDDYLCRLPENSGKCCTAKLERGYLQYLKGSLMLISKLYYGEKAMVPQEVADARAETCLKCPLNIFPDRDMFIAWSDEIMLHSVGERRAKDYEKLGNCEACSCCLKAKVWYKGPFVLGLEEAKKMQDGNPNCWQLEEAKKE